MVQKQELTSEQSLKLIADMIQNTKENLSKDLSKSFINWGYTSAGVTIAVSLLGYLGERYAGFGFFAIPVIGYVLDKITKRKDDQYVNTYTDKIINNVWKIFGLAIWISVFVYGSLAFYTGKLSMWAYILPVSIIFIGLCTAITGAIIKETVVTTLACIGMGIGIGILASLNNDGIYYSQVIASVAAYLISLSIPGHIINHKAKKV